MTVTKAISLYRQAGYLLEEGPDQLLLPEALPNLQRDPCREQLL